jgi:protein-L-isoaspartate(D-aspartate) O-methyltransferase
MEPVGHCLLLVAMLHLVVACGTIPAAKREHAHSSDGATAVPAVDDFEAARRRMVTRDIAARGVRDPNVLAALRKVPRHEFVSASWRAAAYEDRTLPIPHGQTISQPYIVALMTELAALGRRSRVLEVGTGSGYGAAVLAEVAGEVYTIEILDALAREARATLRRLGYGAIHVRQGDGYAGWPAAAPFDAIVVSAAPREVPRPLLAQLREGGRLVIPVGEENQELQVHRRTANGIEVRSVIPVRFVPMTR